MSPVGSLGPCCTVPNCTRPIREHGDLCSQHWRALTSLERRTLTWEAETHAAAQDPVAESDLAEVVLLDGWMNLPAWNEAA